jgi:hypothetical protein
MRQQVPIEMRLHEIADSLRSSLEGKLSSALEHVTRTITEALAAQHQTASQVQQGQGYALVQPPDQAQLHRQRIGASGLRSLCDASEVSSEQPAAHSAGAAHSVSSASCSEPRMPRRATHVPSTAYTVASDMSRTSSPEAQQAHATAESPLAAGEVEGTGSRTAKDAVLQDGADSDHSMAPAAPAGTLSSELIAWFVREAEHRYTLADKSLAHELADVEASAQRKVARLREQQQRTHAPGEQLRLRHAERMLRAQLAEDRDSIAASRKAAKSDLQRQQICWAVLQGHGGIETAQNAAAATAEWLDADVASSVPASVQAPSGYAASTVPSCASDMVAQHQALPASASRGASEISSPFSALASDSAAEIQSVIFEEIAAVKPLQPVAPPPRANPADHAAAAAEQSTVTSAEGALAAAAALPEQQVELDARVSLDAEAPEIADPWQAASTAASEVISAVYEVQAAAGNVVAVESQAQHPCTCIDQIRDPSTELHGDSSNQVVGKDVSGGVRPGNDQEEFLEHISQGHRSSTGAFTVSESMATKSSERHTSPASNAASLVQASAAAMEGPFSMAAPRSLSAGAVDGRELAPYAPSPESSAADASEVSSGEASALESPSPPGSAAATEPAAQAGSDSSGELSRKGAHRVGSSGCEPLRSEPSNVTAITSGGTGGQAVVSPAGSDAHTQADQQVQHIARADSASAEAVSSASLVSTSSNTSSARTDVTPPGADRIELGGAEVAVAQQSDTPEGVTLEVSDDACSHEAAAEVQLQPPSDVQQPMPEEGAEMGVLQQTRSAARSHAADSDAQQQPWQLLCAPSLGALQLGQAASRADSASSISDESVEAVMADVEAAAPANLLGAHPAAAPACGAPAADKAPGSALRAVDPMEETVETLLRSASLPESPPYKR